MTCYEFPPPCGQFVAKMTSGVYTYVGLTVYSLCITQPYDIGLGLCCEKVILGSIVHQQWIITTSCSHVHNFMVCNCKFVMTDLLNQL